MIPTRTVSDTRITLDTIAVTFSWELRVARSVPNHPPCPDTPVRGHPPLNVDQSGHGDVDLEWNRIRLRGT